MTASHIEREDKFDVEADFTVPDVSGLLPPGADVTTSSQRLVNYYFDTADSTCCGLGSPCGGEPAQRLQRIQRIQRIQDGS